MMTISDDRVPAILRQELRRHDAQRGEREHDDRQLEADAERQHHREDKAEVLLRRDERNHRRPAKIHQPRQRQRHDDEDKRAAHPR